MGDVARRGREALSYFTAPHPNPRPAGGDFLPLRPLRGNDGSEAEGCPFKAHREKKMASIRAERMTFLQQQRMALEDALRLLKPKYHARRKLTAKNLEIVLAIQRELAGDLISGRHQEIPSCEK
jgi:hypothetical protein